MPPKRRIGKDDGSGSDTDAGLNVPAVPSPTITMSEDMLQSLVSNITKSQVEANRLLIESLMRDHRERSSTYSPRPDTPAHALRSGNFAKCAARFDGVSKNADELEAFIDAIEVYRDCTNTSEEHALRGLPMLLTGEAAVWWQGVKVTVTSWSEALLRLRGMFGVPRPGYKILREIFAAEQSNERADVFVNKVRAKIAKLPYLVPEQMKLDIVYGLLNRRIRKRVSLDAVDGLDELITKVRLAEEALAEVSCFNNNNASPVNPCVTAQVRSSASPSVICTNVDNNSYHTRIDKPLTQSRESKLNNNPQSFNGINSVSEKRSKPRCLYCRRPGHTIDECHKNPATKLDQRSPTSPDSSQLRCYGCGQLGVIRSNCSSCRIKLESDTSKENLTSQKESEFCSAQVVDNSDPRPLVEIKVVNRTGVAILDTGATHSIAGPMLYRLLVDAGVKFSRTSRVIGLADGSKDIRKTLDCDVSVILQGRTILTRFLVLPDAQTRTLLGRDFIMKAGIVIDLPQNGWSFNDEPSRWYPFVDRFVLPPTSDVKNITVGTRDLGFRHNGSRRQDSVPFKIKPDSSAYCLRAVPMQGEELKARSAKGSPGKVNGVSDAPFRPTGIDAVKLYLNLAEVEFASKSLDVRRKRHKETHSQRISKDRKPPDDPFRGRVWYRTRQSNAAYVRKHIADENHSPTPDYSIGSLVFLKTQGKDVAHGQTPKFKPRQDGPYRIRELASPTTYVLDRVRSSKIQGRYHVSQLTPYVGVLPPPAPVREKRRRGRPNGILTDQVAGALRLGQRGRM